MAKYINIKTGRPKICGRAPLVINDRHSMAAKTARYYRYQLLFNHYHPVNKKIIIVKPVIRQLPIAVDTSLKTVKIKWLETASQWIGELFTREKSTQEVLSSTA